jgi:CHAT domain-containing protein
MGRMQARSLEDKLVEQRADEKDSTIVAAAGRGNVFVGFAGAVDLGPFARNQLLLNYGLAADGFIPYVVVADADGLLMATAALDSLESAFPESDYEWRTALSRLVSEFRSLASRQVETRGAAAAAVTRDQTSARRLEIGRLLYDALIGPIQSELEDKSELIIVPDGLLAFVPFESLVLPDGSYLAKHFDIKYAQSLAVRQITLNRDYEDSRKPMLAFGGAVYESAETTLRPDDRSDVEPAVIQNTAYSTLNRGGDQSGNYSALGYASWNDLPGTLEEVNAIADIVGSSVVVTGADVSERTVKNLSSSGELAGYRVIHFATHGLVVPEVPELSALVLSQNQAGEEDGYLRMDEIADLKIRADFVNLSACETGLGKLYGGEGVVGLTQSFILAGANGLSVSLWQVADESTSLFMEEMYRLVADQSISYSAAIAEVKRMFIAGDFGEQYRDPYYWAPFVYYGR